MQNKIQEKVQSKIEIFKNVDANSKTLILDFDRTLICGKVNDVEVPSITSILRNENHLDEDYAKRAHALFEHYHAIEKNPDMSDADKSEKMHEWWTRHFDIMIEKKLNIKHIYQAVQSELLVFRPGVKEMLQQAFDKNIQVVILSANGLGYDSIKLLLERDHITHDNIEIISNKMVWGNDGVMTGYLEPLIHSGNKYNFISNEQIEKNIIIIGDGLHDAFIVKDSTANTPQENKKNILRIGIYENTKTGPSDSNLEKYHEAFDVVMINDEIDFKKVLEFL